MASKKTARGAKKTAKATTSGKPARAAKNTAQAKGAAKAPRAKAAALAPAGEKPQPIAVDAGGHGVGRAESIEAGLAKLRQRLRFSPPKQRGTRTPPPPRPERDLEGLDKALKRLSESYRDLFK